MNLVIKKWLAWLIPVIALLTIVAWQSGAYYLNQEKLKVTKSRVEALSLVKGSLEGWLDLPVAHIESLARHEKSVLNALERRQNHSSIDALTENFRTLLSRNPEYLQIRWIDEQGRELVRLDQDRYGTIRQVVGSELQNKLDRPYVSETLKLSEDQIFISALDLNVENGRIEVPHVPVLRVAKHLYGRDGLPAGLIVLNIRADHKLAKVDKVRRQFNVGLLNADGFWLNNSDPAKEFAFQSGGQDSLATLDPKLWAKFSNSASGESESENGIWVWQTIHALAQRPNIAAPVWKIVSNVSPAEIDTLAYPIQNELLLISLLSLLFIAARVQI